MGQILCVCGVRWLFQLQHSQEVVSKSDSLSYLAVWRPRLRPNRQNRLDGPRPLRAHL